MVKNLNFHRANFLRWFLNVQDCKSVFLINRKLQYIHYPILYITLTPVYDYQTKIIYKLLINISIFSAVFTSLPSNEPIRVLVRVYVIKAKVRNIKIPLRAIRVNFIKACKILF